MRRLTAAATGIAVLALTSCAWQSSAPGGLQIVDAEPVFTVCSGGSFDEVVVTVRSQDLDTVVWRAEGSYEVADSAQLDHDTVAATSTTFDSIQLPFLQEGDTVSLELVEPGGASTNTTFAVTPETLGGSLVDAAGAATDAPCG